MTNARRIQLHPHLVGFDPLLNEIEQFLNAPTTDQTKYPPHNIVKYKNNENLFRIDVAVAGFSKDEIMVMLDSEYLDISGSKNSKDEDEYVHKGISTRDFRKRIRVPKTIVVRNAWILDGVLRISIENIVPEDKTPQIIPITLDWGSSEPVSKQELLNENKDR